MKDLEYRALACPVCHCLHKIHKDESYLYLLKCHCCGESLGKGKKETLYYPKGGYALHMVDKSGQVRRPVTTLENITRHHAVRILTDWWGVDNLERWVKMLDETEIVFNDTNTFALKRVAD